MRALIDLKAMIRSFASRLKDLAVFVARQSVWHPEALPVEEFKYRHLKRFWLPLFDVLCIIIAHLAYIFGSPLLHALYPQWVIDVVSVTFLFAASVALVGIAFPRLWIPEIIGKLVMLGLLGTYSATVWTSFFRGEVQSGFVAAILVTPLLLPMFRLQLLGEEIKQRRDEENEREAE